MHAGTETGSLITHVMTTSPQPTPTRGMGVTLCLWTDRKAGTIVKVSPSGKTITIQEDRAVRSDGNGMSDCQTYTYHADPQGSLYTARLGKKGWKVTEYGYGVILGSRRAYYDYSF